MAVYKVLQDIEAEDKLVGPLTLKGFIYAAAASVLGFINFKLLISTSGNFKWLLILIFLPPMILFGVLASPLGRQQPTEVWLLARIRFLLKPRKRLWDQTGISKLVTITAPIKVEKPRTKGLSETEVHSRLQTLALTLDSRGWAIKNLRLPISDESEGSDRLITPTVITPIAADTDIDASDDILDEQNNPTAQNFAALMKEADASRKLDTAKIIGKAREEAAAESVKTVVKSEVKSQTKTEKTKPPKVVTRREQADKLELAQSGSALSVASVAKLANRIQQIGPNEVVISLH